MAQASAPLQRVTHSEINLKFGLERAIEFNFAPRDRNWSCLKNTQDTARTVQSNVSEQIDEQDKKEIFETKIALE